MQDRFKFRFWHKPTEKMVNCYGYNSDFVFGDVLDGIGTEYNPAKFNDCILMQSTGLKDKNDKLIYEGDIVNVLPEIDEIAIIEWGNEEAKFIINHYFEKYISTFENYYGEDLEIVGNIYENPELLEVNNQNERY